VTHVSSKSRAPKRRSVDPDDYDPDEDAAAGGETLSHDEQLTLFLRRPPIGAERVLVLAFTASGDHTMQDRSAAECRAAPVQLANTIMQLCERWARTEGRETRFRAQWQAGERTLASHQWRCGEGDPTALDGTVESFMGQAQRHLEHRDRIHLEAYSEQNTGWKELVAELRGELKVLRAENQDLRERLRKANDVDAEIALATTESELARKGRMSDMLEHRVLPLLQHLALKAANGVAASGGESATATAETRDTPK
jgi:hypothetical protein